MSKEQKLITRKHLARQERERIQTRYILIVTAVIFAAVIVLIGYGIVNELILKPNQPVATVNNEKISLKEFQTRVRYTRNGIISQYLDMYQFSQMFGGDESSAQYFNSQLSQISMQLEPTYLGQNVLDELVDDRIIRAEAKALGITVTKEEVDKALEEAFAFYRNGTPTPEPTFPAKPTSTLSPTQLALVPPTPTQVITQTATPTSQPTATEEPTPGPTSEPTLTPTVYTEDVYKKNYNDTLSNLKTTISVSEADLRKIFESSLYKQKVLDIVTADLEPQEEQVWARHILVIDEATAQTVLTRLHAGEDFVTLAAEFSTDGSAQQGGDLGWFGKGKMVPAFEEVAFQLEIGQISEPVQSSFGWHIIQVLGHEIRPLDSSTFDSLREEKFNTWLEEKRNAAEIDINESWINNVPTEPSIPAEYQVAPSF